MIVSMTAFDRVEYAAEVAESLRVARERLDEPVTLVVSLDWSERSGEMRELLAPDVLLDQTQRRGLQLNTRLVLDRAWELAGERGDDFVLHLEDDLVLAPDALECAAWLRDRYRDDDRVGWVSLTEVHTIPGDDDHHAVGLFPWFECHVWGTWRPMWEQLRGDWPHEWSNHWAARVNDRSMFGTVQARPLLSRSRSIGVYGQNCNPSFHERHNPRVYAGDLDVAEGDWHEAAAVALSGQEAA